MAEGTEQRADWKGLSEALAERNSIADQALALTTFLVACVVWRVAPLRTPDSFVDAVFLVGALGLMMVATLAWAKHEDAIMLTDQMILVGFGGLAEQTSAERFLARRIRSIENSRSRRRLANGLRKRLHLVGVSTASVRQLPVSGMTPMTAAQRAVLLEEKGLVAALAERVERSPVDPRALVMLWRVVHLPPPVGPQSQRRMSEELRARLHTAWQLIDDSPPALDKAA